MYYVLCKINDNIIHLKLYQEQIYLLYIVESFIKFSFWNPSLLLQKKEFLLRFLYAFKFCN